MQPHPKLPDFDTLMRLSRQDPNAYETFRTQLLADAIADCPPSAPEKHAAGLDANRNGPASGLDAA